MERVQKGSNGWMDGTENNRWGKRKMEMAWYNFMSHIKKNKHCIFRREVNFCAGASVCLRRKWKAWPSPQSTMTLEVVSLQKTHCQFSLNHQRRKKKGHPFNHLARFAQWWRSGGQSLPIGWSTHCLQLKNKHLTTGLTWGICPQPRKEKVFSSYEWCRDLTWRLLTEAPPICVRSSIRHSTVDKTALVSPAKSLFWVRKWRERSEREKVISSRLLCTAYCNRNRTVGC